MKVRIFTTGGTIDKVYFDALSEFQVGETALHDIFDEANVAFEHVVEPLMRKDSLEINDADRELICQKVTDCEESRILITHGTDTMADTAKVLSSIAGKTIVLVGAMQPARLRSSDAIFNIGFASAMVQALSSGVYIAMNGQVFDAGHVKKNRAAGRFETLD